MFFNIYHGGDRDLPPVYNADDVVTTKTIWVCPKCKTRHTNKPNNNCHCGNDIFKQLVIDLTDDELRIKAESRGLRYQLAVDHILELRHTEKQKDEGLSGFFKKLMR